MVPSCAPVGACSSEDSTHARRHAVWSSSWTRQGSPAATRASPYSLASGLSAPCAMPSAVLSTVDADWVKVRACADTEGAPHGVRVRLPRGRGWGLFACPLFGRSDCDGFFTRALRRGGGGVECARERGRAPQRVASIGALSGRIVLSVWLTCHCLHRRCPTHCAASLVPINAVVVRLNLLHPRLREPCRNMSPRAPL